MKKKKKKWISPVATLIRGPGISRSCGAVESSDDDANRWLGHGPRPQTLLQPNIHLCQVRHEADRTVINVFFSLSRPIQSQQPERGLGVVQRKLDQLDQEVLTSISLHLPIWTELVIIQKNTL